uniref:Annexin n=1 Tax=Xenopsylla cheopis TaxID=163159 RepID=A0A6M2DP87_XENCH
MSFYMPPSPTVLPAEGFDPRADAAVLRKAMKGFGTDEKSIIEVLTKRSNEQRQAIELEFKTLYGKDLIDDLKSELTGNLEKLVVALMTPLPKYIAKQLEKAMKGLGTDEETLIEIFCTMTNLELETIRHVYESMYGKSLEEELMSETSGNFRRLMVSLCNANRDESIEVDEEAAMTDAQKLLQAGELKYFGTDESTFNMILCQRSYPQLRAVFHCYEKIVGHSIEEAIKNEFSGDIKDGLLAIVESVRDKAKFFAKRLYKSMKGLGTNDNQLVRIVVTRCEVDMGDIKRAFAQEYGDTLEEFIKGDCSGDYKRCLIALIS